MAKTLPTPVILMGMDREALIVTDGAGCHPIPIPSPGEMFSLTGNPEDPRYVVLGATAYADHALLEASEDLSVECENLYGEHLYFEGRVKEL